MPATCLPSTPGASTSSPYRSATHLSPLPRPPIVEDGVEIIHRPDPVARQARRVGNIDVHGERPPEQHRKVEAKDVIAAAAAALAGEGHPILPDDFLLGPVDAPHLDHLLLEGADGATPL